jgi:hypothetical protein
MSGQGRAARAAALDSLSISTGFLAILTADVILCAPRLPAVTFSAAAAAVIGALAAGLGLARRRGEAAAAGGWARLFAMTPRWGGPDPLGPVLPAARCPWCRRDPADENWPGCTCRAACGAALCNRPGAGTST